MNALPTLTRPPRPARGILCFEDFDAAAQAAPRLAAPPAPPPPLTDADLAAARDAGFAEGRSAALAQVQATSAQAARAALAAIAAGLGDAAGAARTAAEEQAGAIAQLLLGALGAVLPSLCARFGAAEAAAMALEIQHVLQHEPAVRVRVNPHTRASLSRELAVLEPELRERLDVIETDAVAEGDARIEWHGGTAARDAAALWRAVTGVLEPLGLLDAAGAG